MKKAKVDGNAATLIKDKLSINGQRGPQRENNESMAK